MSAYDEESTPRESGLHFGAAVADWIGVDGVAVEGMTAEAALKALADVDSYDKVLDADVVDSTHTLREAIMESGMPETLEAAGDPNAEAQFWGGFVIGVRARLVALSARYPDLMSAESPWSSISNDEQFTDIMRILTAAQVNITLADAQEIARVLRARPAGEGKNGAALREEGEER